MTVPDETVLSGWSTMAPVLKPLGRGFVPRLLAGLFAGVVNSRNAWYDTFPAASVASPFPTISIGGIHAGGTGKTPLVIVIGKELLRRGYPVGILSRGYGRRTRDPIIVHPGEEHSWEEIGDEPSQISRSLPETWLGIGPDRAANAQRLARFMAPDTVLLLDDGFQHRRLRRAIDIVCLPANPFDALLIPAGFLREPLTGLRRAQMLCLIGSRDDEAVMQQSLQKLRHRFPTQKLHCLYQHPVGWKNLKTGEIRPVLPVKNPALISGIARPDRFVALVRALGIQLSRQHIFADHHPFSQAELDPIFAAAANGIITTEKDACRLSALRLVKAPAIWYLIIELCFFTEQEHTLFSNDLTAF
jgi:tetraacyldisaccharide 4'-kinase